MAGMPSLSASASVRTVGWASHSDVGLHVLKLFAAGVFNRNPMLEPIIGHIGETLSFILERLL